MSIRKRAGLGTMDRATIRDPLPLPADKLTGIEAQQCHEFEDALRSVDAAADLLLRGSAVLRLTPSCFPHGQCG